MPAPGNRRTKTKRKIHMAKQISLDERINYDRWLRAGWSVSRIARESGRGKSSVVREIAKRSVPCNRGYGTSNRICAKFDQCTRRKGYGGNPKRLFRYTPGCFEACPEFVERTCALLDSPSRVCNGCAQFGSCPMRKRIYDANAAQAGRESLLHDSRRGIHPSPEQVSAMNEVLSRCLRQGQSIHAVVVNNPDVFKGVGERSVYQYLSEGLFDAKRFDLPEACRRRPRKRKERPVTKTDARCRVNRTYKEFLEFCRVNGIEEFAEIDTVIGEIGGKLLFTIYLPGGLMLAFLRERKTSATCVRVFNALWRAAGPELFLKLFLVVLADNGGEFSDPVMIENFRPDPVHNPKKLQPRGIRLFYCDAYCSSQKPHVERTHRDMRRILEHGTSFNALDQNAVNLVMSHVNSYTRGVQGDRAPYDAFVERFGEPGRAFLEKMGIVRIPPNDVMLKPELLGERYARHAAMVTLKKYGVEPQK